MPILSRNLYNLKVNIKVNSIIETSFAIKQIQLQFELRLF